MKVVVTFQYRIKDSTSRRVLSQMAGSVNYVWNYVNELSYRSIRERHHWMTAYDLSPYTKGATPELGLHSDTVQAIAETYVKSRKQFKKNKLRWRTGKRNLGWIPFKAKGVKVEKDTIRYRGHSFRFWKSRDFPENARLVTGSFNQDAEGKWYVNLQFSLIDFQKPIHKSSQEIGIDLGLRTIATSSEQQFFERPNLTKEYEERLAKAQRSKKKRKVTKIHAKIRNKRKDWNHKVTSQLLEENRLIRIGDVNSGALMKTKMAKSVGDASWYQFKSMLRNKAIMQGVDYKETNESYSTVTCSACGERTGPRGLEGLRMKEWQCSHCGSYHERDVNAAKNILAFALSKEKGTKKKKKAHTLGKR